MAANSAIEWTESTWNPVTGCTKISEGCAHCYAERMALRLKAMGQKNYANGFQVTLHPHALEIPLKWKIPHMIFVSKNFRGYDIMKEIMAKESSRAEQGVPSFEYSPADFLPKQSLLFQLSRPLEDLQDTLLEAYAGRTLPMRAIYENHSVDTPYIASNYKEALKNLENDGKITARKSDGSKRRKGTFADDVLAIFPDKKE